MTWNWCLGLITLQNTQTPSGKSGGEKKSLTGRNLRQIQAKDEQPSVSTSWRLQGQKQAQTNKLTQETEPSISRNTYTCRKDERHKSKPINVHRE